METRLYIGSYKVELDTEPSILYNYAVTDYSNPTAVRNGFSKTVTIKGSPNNNKIFGMYWNVERRVGSGGQNGGVDYNASKKAPFKLFVGAELYEEGYVRLDKINRINNEITYDCTLFSGLGDYFYNLAYNPNNGEKRKLSDFNYWSGGTDEFDFTETATTINEAWEALANGTEGKWQHINFMPAYNGIPQDFNADKVIINLDGTSLPQSDETGLFRPKAGTCVIADLPEEMTEWEMRDLRSYLQRPCIRMKSIIDACCDPDQNGGYTVDLDPDFFNNDNPYYSKTWLSLPLPQNLEYASEEQVLDGVRLVGLTTTGDSKSYMYQDLRFEVGEFGSATPSSINIDAKIYCNNIFNNLIPGQTESPFDIMEGLMDITTPYTSYMWFWRNNGDSYHTNWACLGSLFCQVIALNGEAVVAASEVYNLTSPIRHNGKLYYGHNGRYPAANQYKPYMDKNIYDVFGGFYTDGWHKEGSSSPATLTFHINGINSPVSALKMVYFWGASEDKEKHGYKKCTLFAYEQQSVWIDFDPDPSATMTPDDPTLYSIRTATTDFKAVLGESLGRSGTKITKSLLLNTKDSPMDYLLSYGKTFGLYFTKVLGENRIKIETRKTFYHRDEVVNLNDYIDRSKDIKINPIAFNTKWYELSHEMDESDYSKKYESARGVQYGCKILNTGYEFDVKKEKLLENSVIRSGIEGLERSKFFSAFNNDNVQRSWMGMGLHYNLYLFDTAMDVDVPVRDNNDLRGINENEGMKYYDVFPKLQFHKADNEPSDGNNVLVFFSGFKDLVNGRTNPISYYLSDDNAYQTIYNDGTPCWLFTPTEEIDGQHLTYKVNALPVFERYLTNNGSGTVDKSLDFGTAQELYIPDYNLPEEANLYTNFWKEYLEDLFDADTKVLECYVRVVGRIGDEWLRRFYWFDNAIWRLNKVTDWQVGSDGLTQMEFIRVQNITNYNSTTQTQSTIISLMSNNYYVDFTGETITLTVSINTGGSWRITSTDGAILSRSNGTGNGTLTATIPANNTDGLKYWYFTASSDDGATARITIAQSYDGETDFVCQPTDLIIPASGGDATVDFIWTNQGEDYIDAVDFNEGEDYLQFSADTSTYQTQNKAVLSFSANTGSTVLHNYCQFQSRSGLARSIGIDQVPSGFTFDASGGSATISFDYNSAVTITGPEWVTIEKSGNTFTITARPNYYDNPNNAQLTITDGHSTVNMGVNQAGGSGGGVTSDFEVSPANLYFSNSGGTQFITITSRYAWYYKPFVGEWWSLSNSNGSGSQTISIVVPENTGATRSNYAEFGAMIDGVEVVKKVYVSQAAPDASGITITVSPSSTTVAQSGETITYTVTVSDMNGLELVVTPSRNDGAIGTVGTIATAGNVSTVPITYQANDAYNTSKTWTVSFDLRRNGTYVTGATITPTQSGSNSEYWNGSGSTSGGSGGGSTGITPTTNTCWTASAFTSTAATVESIGFETADWAINNLIDTGIRPTQTSTIRYKYRGRGRTSDRILGTIDGYQGCDDSHDYRFFDIIGLTFDIGDTRHGGYWSGDATSNNTDYDVTMGNAYVKDNINDTYYFNEGTDTVETAFTYTVDVGSVWCKEVIIEDNGVTLFHGVPYSQNGVVGLYDSVSNTVKTLYSGSTGTLIANGGGLTPADWITVTPSGCGSDTLFITTTPNTGTTSRTGYVIVYSQATGNILKTITVTQDGFAETLLVSPSSLVFDSNGGTATFTITSNTNWTIE